jgi:hypothetical protein
LDSGINPIKLTSVFYLMCPLTVPMAHHLKSEGHLLPDPPPASRPPLLREVRGVLETLEGYRSSCRVHQQKISSVDFEVVDDGGYYAGWSTMLWVTRIDIDDRTHPPGEDDPVEVCSHKGDPELAVCITERLTRRCGPLVLTLDVDCQSLVVTPGISVSSAVGKWLAS